MRNSTFFSKDVQHIVDYICMKLEVSKKYNPTDNSGERVLQVKQTKEIG